MESATFASKPDAKGKLGEAVRMMMIKDKFVVDAGLPSLLVPTRRAFFFNRRPTSITALTRRGVKENADCDFEVSNLFATYDNDAAIAVGRKGEVALLELKVTADGAASIAVVNGKVGAEIVAATFLSNSLESVALLSNGSIVKLSADLATVTELRKDTSFKGKFIAAHDDFVLVPAKDGIDIISLSTKKSALTNAWVPHSQGEPILAVHVFRKWKPTGGSNIVMTVGANGREVRLWTGLGNGSLELAANLSLDIAKADEKFIAVADQEENVIITYGKTAVVLSTDENRIRFARATEWELEASGPFGAYNETTKAGTYQLSMVTRTPECITSTKLPPSIFGAANLTADGAAAAKTTTHEREHNYFAAAATKETSSAVSVHSSLAPAAADSGVAEKAAANAITFVASEVVRKAGVLKGQTMATQKDLTDTIASLQSQSTQAAAAKQGKDHAARNASRFTNQQSASAAAPAATAASSAAAAGKNVEQLSLLCDHMQAAVEKAITVRADSALAPKVKAAVDAIGGEADNNDVALPKLTSVPQMQAFNANIDKALKAQNDFLKAEADSRAATYNAQVIRSSTTTRQSIAESKKFLADLKAELSGLTKDIEAVKVELVSSSNRAAIGSVNTANVVEEAVALVEKKDFEQAVSKVTQAKNFQLLLEFLGHPIVKAAHDAGAFVPGSISAPAFGMLVQQLAADIDAAKGHIAPRVAWLYAVCMDWDDYIDETNETEGESKAKTILTTLSPSMNVARRNVENLANIKEDVSIESRRQARTVARVLGKFL